MTCRRCFWCEWSPLRAISWCRKFWRPARGQCAYFLFDKTKTRDAQP